MFYLKVNWTKNKMMVFRKQFKLKDAVISLYVTVYLILSLNTWSFTHLPTHYSSSKGFYSLADVVKISGDIARCS